jgi:hypothetical protein
MRRHLDALDDWYAALLPLTPHVDDLVAGATAMEDARRRYETDGYVRLPGIVPEEAIEGLAQDLWPILSPLAFDLVKRHETGPTGLSAGHRLRRVDPRSLDPEGPREMLAAVLEALGLVEFFRLLAERLAPLLRLVIDGAAYERVFFNLYDEGDYITAHDDAHMGDRIDVNFSVTLDGVGGLRVLHDGLLRMHYDGAGAMSILGPRVWHEVPPLMRTTPDTPPRRLTVTMRYW